MSAFGFMPHFRGRRAAGVNRSTLNGGFSIRGSATLRPSITVLCCHLRQISDPPSLYFQQSIGRISAKLCGRGAGLVLWVWRGCYSLLVFADGGRQLRSWTSFEETLEVLVVGQAIHPR
jgi:hypothetical protein